MAAGGTGGVSSMPVFILGAKRRLEGFRLLRIQGSGKLLRPAQCLPLLGNVCLRQG